MSAATWALPPKPARPCEVIAALEHGDDPPRATAVRDLHEPARHPAELLLADIEARQGVAPMRVEAR